MFHNIMFSNRLAFRKPGFMLFRNIANLSTNEIRKEFLAYFEANGHKRLSPSSLLPKGDDSILFTNAGMVQFKKTFISPEDAEYRQVTTIQPCIRTGGKHNDLDNVGKTPRHHTLFEMLGNFSFASYNKAKAIKLAWTFLTKELDLPADRLRVSVLEGDESTLDVWRNEIGLGPDSIMIMPSSENFWSMGESEGPCGSCTEIYWNMKRDDIDPNHPDQWMELWNIVFMDSWQSGDDVSKLSHLSIDTGMGLERLASVLQNKHDNFETDDFQLLISGIKELLERTKSESRQIEFNENKISEHYKIIADHIRSASMLIAHGVTPNNTGRGYVLRRIIRRAVRSVHQLGGSNGFLNKIFYLLEQSFGSIYTELVSKRTIILDTLSLEEASFAKNLDRGSALLLNEIKKCKGSNIEPSVVFDLYHTHGFPIDLTQIIAAERGKSFNVKDVEELMEKAREQSKSSQKVDPIVSNLEKLALGKYLSNFNKGEVTNTFSGYPEEVNIHEPQYATIIDLKKLSPQKLALVIDPCPFYDLGGGQTSDTGLLALQSKPSVFYNVTQVKTTTTNSKKIKPPKQTTVIIIEARAEPGQSSLDAAAPVIDASAFKVGEAVKCLINPDLRRNTSAHHTATHLLHSALRKVLKGKVLQKGSFVSAHKMSFDFQFKGDVTNEQVTEVEELVNFWALRNMKLQTKTIELHQAKGLYGALGDYGDNPDPTELVRVVSYQEDNLFPAFETPEVLRPLGKPAPKLKKKKTKQWFRKEIEIHPNVASVELCCGTHLPSTLGVYPFIILTRSGVGSGVTRIAALAGTAASEYLMESNQLLHELASLSLNQDKLFSRKTLKSLASGSAPEMIDTKDINPKYRQSSRVSPGTMSKEIIQTISSNVRKTEETLAWVQIGSSMIPDKHTLNCTLNKDAFKEEIGVQIFEFNQILLLTKQEPDWNLDYDNVKVKVSIMPNIPEPELVKSWINERAEHLSTVDPESIHIVTQDSKVVVVVGKNVMNRYKKTAVVHASNLMTKLTQLEEGKGGGNQKVAKGLLKNPIDADDQASVDSFITKISPLISSAANTD